MKRFTFEMLIENSNLNMIQSDMGNLMSSASYYAKEFHFEMTDIDMDQDKEDIAHV